MNNTLLLQQFDLLATAPGGVAQLRELILTLAVQGKLVPQNPADEPASALLKRIRAEKDRLVAAGKIKRDKPLAAIEDDEKPFGLPSGWEWVRLPEIYYSISPSGSKLLSSAVELEGAYPVVDQGQRYVAGYTNDSTLLINIPGPVVVFGDHTKEIKYIDFNFVAGADGTKILRPVLQNERFFTWQLRSFPLQDRGYARHFKVLNACLFALPPIPEQARIVARVEELMRVCDVLETTGQRQAAHHRQLVQTLLGQLTAAPYDSAPPNPPNHPAQPHPTSPPSAAIPNPWQRVAAHFDTLLDRPSAVDALEQTILQLAVRGQLVPQDPTDEPASELLKRIRAEKDRLIAAGKIKRDKPLAPIGEEEQPFELPPGWEWVPLQHIGYTQTGTTPDKKHAAFYGTHIPFIKPGDIYPEHVDYENEGLSALGLKDSGRLAPAGSILMVCIGTIGKTNLITKDCSFNQQINSITPLCCISEFISLALRCSTFQSEAWLRSSSTTISILNKGKWEGIPFPLPPLPEQARIVARVAHLRRLCAELRQRLTQSQTTQAALAEALVAEIT